MTGLPIKIYLFIALGVAALATAGVFIHGQRELVREQERAKQVKANEELRNRATAGGVDYDICDRAGGLYDFARRACKFP